MSSAKSGSQAVDEARTTLCREFARMLNSGSWSVRARIVGPSDEPEAVWFYAHSADGWQKQADSVTDGPVVLAIQEAVQMLGSKGQGDEWSIRQHSSGGQRDTDIEFHREKLQHRVGTRLESALMGLLFRDSHDSKKDVRRSIRTRH